MVRGVTFSEGIDRWEDPEASDQCGEIREACHAEDGGRSGWGSLVWISQNWGKRVMNGNSHLKMCHVAGLRDNTEQAANEVAVNYLSSLAPHTWLYWFCSHIADESKWLVMWHKRCFRVSRKTWDDLGQVLLHASISPTRI